MKTHFGGYRFSNLSHTDYTMKNSNHPSHYMDLASTFITDLKYDRLSPEVLKRAKLVLLDTLGLGELR